MKRLVALGLLLFSLSSVQWRSSDTFLPQEQMVSILVDLELARALVGHYTDDEATASQWLKQNALLVYQAHDIAPDTFQKSYQHYLTQLEVMQEIYEAVIDRLEELEDQL